MLPWFLRSTAPYEGDVSTLLVFSTSPNVIDHFYVKRQNGGIDVKVVCLLFSPLQGQGVWWEGGVFVVSFSFFIPNCNSKMVAQRPQRDPTPPKI